MPPLPMKDWISSWGKSRATSATVGGTNGVASGCAAVSGAAPCLSRHAGQSPSSAPVGNTAPHCGHFVSMFSFVWVPFIHPTQKQIRANVTGKKRNEVLDWWSNGVMGVWVLRCFRCNANNNAAKDMRFPNPNGIESFSPRLRGTSHLGSRNHKKNTTLKGLNTSPLRKPIQPFQGWDRGNRHPQVGPV